MSASQLDQDTGSTAGPPRSLAAGLVKALRPRQWVKNILVFAAPVAALGDDRYAYDYREVLVKVLLAFVVFSLAASSVYLSTTHGTSMPTAPIRRSGSARSRRAWCRNGWRTRWRRCSVSRRW